MTVGTRLVLIPSFNTGARLLQTVREARAAWTPVWVVIDGSTDGSEDLLRRSFPADPGLRVIVLPRNQGKGGAVFHGLQQAAVAGFSHALIMDSDGQHAAHAITEMMAASSAAPDAMILGLPVFGPEAPRLRVRGRRISNWWANLETLWTGIGDSLFGFRVYPIRPLLSVMQNNRWMRRFDFDPEAAVRLCWRGVRPINVPSPVLYLSQTEGGVSHFKYGRDNLLLTWMHIRLVLGMLLRLPHLILQRSIRTNPRPDAVKPPLDH
jgi:glycosyltransferase involved in cell wall biosynthesis